MKICYLKISSWVGISAGATHIYGELRYCKERESVRLVRKIGRKECAELNESDGAKVIGSYEAGEETSRFNSTTQIRQKAGRDWKKHFPDAEILICGSNCVLDPQEILKAPNSELKKAANRIWRKTEKIDGWDGGQDELMQKLCDEWDELIGV